MTEVNGKYVFNIGRSINPLTISASVNRIIAPVYLKNTGYFNNKDFII